ncbi:MAG: tRNA preQ1(34) S-adenosylmethionine ribosyltransferase-isomerase QueA [Thermodesulfobacteriota bacterium]
MKIQEFDYHLPPELIAQHPVPQRDQSRLLVLKRQEKTWEHRIFADLPQYLNPGDLLIINDTKVIPVRLYGRKESGGKVEILLVKEVRNGDQMVAEGDGDGTILERWPNLWQCLVKGAHKLRENTPVFFDEELSGILLRPISSGLWLLGFPEGVDFKKRLGEIGFPPLPPYIKRNGDSKRKAEDLIRYQTVYAQQEGSIAAPTAGLHFTPELLERIKEKGVLILPITLHVGLGTFLPVKKEEVENHRLPAESFVIPDSTAAALNKARSSKQRIIAVGTTVTRALESALTEKGEIKPGPGETNLFIIPGYKFRIIDCLITNFHLPRSTLLMLVYAFGGKEFMRKAYAEAIKEKYRFYSYGDAMFII